jgi:putative transposase
MKLPHRKRIKHFEEQPDVHELTFSCFQRRPLLTNDLWRTWFCEGLDKACKRRRFLLLAYVIMPEHVHLLVWPLPERKSNLTAVQAANRRKSRIAGLLSSIKRPFSVRVKKHLADLGSPLLERLTVRQRPDTFTFRFWQEGPGYDRNMTESEAILSAIDYIHENPVRRRLCRKAVDWHWSSAARLITDGRLEEVPRLSRFDPCLGRIEW